MVSISANFRNSQFKMYTLWSWVLPERPLDVRPLDTFPAFHGTLRFNTYSQELSTCSYPEPDQSSPHHAIPPLQDPS
jgi:hypothetical protein